MPIMRTYIAGTMYKEGGKKILPTLPAGQNLSLKAEPTNPYDKNAVAVYMEDIQLGYVPKVDAPTIAKVLASGQPVQIRLTAKGMASIEIVWGEVK